METGKFVEMLDELNRLKNEGFIDENEYEKQVNKLKKQYSKESNNYYGRNLVNNTNTTRANVNTNEISQIVSIFLVFVFVIVGFWFFYSGEFENLVTSGKKSINTFENYTASENSYNYDTSGTSIYDTNNSSSNNNNKPSSNTNNNKSNIQTQPENKKTYNVNVRKVAENIFENNIYVGRGDFDKYVLTVMNYQTETNNSKVGGVKDGQEWVIVNMKFENKSDSTVVIDKNDFKIVDGADRYGYRPWYEHLDTELGTIEIRSGQTATFSVRFVYYKNNEMFLRYYNLDFDPIGYVAIKLR